MLTLKFILKFINLLNKEASPRSLAGGMALGAILGITPTYSLHNIVVLILILMIRVNISAAMLSWGIFALFSWLFDPFFNKVGYTLLVKVPALKPLWTALYNMPIVPWTKFNNTLTLGSLVVALVLFWPLYFIFVWAVKRYRENVLTAINKFKIVQVLKASKLFGLYQSYNG